VSCNGGSEDGRRWGEVGAGEARVVMAMARERVARVRAQE